MSPIVSSSGIVCSALNGLTGWLEGAVAEEPAEDSAVPPAEEGTLEERVVIPE
jgi:hypothetical protein